MKTAATASAVRGLPSTARAKRVEIATWAWTAVVQSSVRPGRALADVVTGDASVADETPVSVGPFSPGIGVALEHPATSSSPNAAAATTLAADTRTA